MLHGHVQQPEAGGLRSGPLAVLPHPTELPPAGRQRHGDQEMARVVMQGLCDEAHGQHIVHPEEGIAPPSLCGCNLARKPHPGRVVHIHVQVQERVTVAGGRRRPPYEGEGAAGVEPPAAACRGRCRRAASAGATDGPQLLRKVRRPTVPMPDHEFRHSVLARLARQHHRNALAAIRSVCVRLAGLASNALDVRTEQCSCRRAVLVADHWRPPCPLARAGVRPASRVLDLGVALGARLPLQASRLANAALRRPAALWARRALREVLLAHAAFEELVRVARVAIRRAGDAVRPLAVAGHTSEVRLREADDLQQLQPSTILTV
mmetsp:Transcript_8443/g.21568  ORF Transcript_8443/g.21568 Transcript_8443/m.21568 type:complete len:321 (-) Transcript_8443:1414-2376(-)